VGQQPPSPGQVSPDARFVWDGSRWNPITTFRWEPTETTRRMQLLAGGYLVAAGLLTVILTFFAAPYVRESTRRALLQSPRNQALTADQLKQILDFSVTLGVVISVVVGLIFVAFGLMTLFRRWSWLFYADLVIFGIGALGVFTSLYTLGNGTSGPLGLAIPNLLLSALELALFIWMLVTRLQGAVWGARKVPNL
jgi:multisubunit Na+/H+ antiporter MnhB subunit